MPQQKRAHVFRAIAICAIGALFALAAAQLLLHDTDSVSSEPVPIYALSTSDEAYLAIREMAPEIQAARRASSVSEILEQTRREPAVVIVDSTTANGLASRALQPLSAAGYVLVGLNVPVDELAELAGFRSEVGSINPIFERELKLTPAQFDDDFFTILWRTPRGTTPSYWGQTQQQFTQELFSVILEDYRLRARGLIADPDGSVVPLDEFGPTRTYDPSRR